MDLLSLFVLWTYLKHVTEWIVCSSETVNGWSAAKEYVEDM